MMEKSMVGRVRVAIIIKVGESCLFDEFHCVFVFNMVENRMFR